VILRFYDAVRGTALAGDIPARREQYHVSSHYALSLPRSVNLQVNEIAFVILHGFEAVRLFAFRGDESSGVRIGVDEMYVADLEFRILPSEISHCGLIT
jgi:hypothetical protein